MAALPLAGVRVLDFGTLIAAPIATQVLCDLGAEVIKVEPPHSDYLRTTGGPVGPMAEGVEVDRPYNRRPWFNELNRGKLDIALDLQTAEGIAIVKRLVRLCDVVIENFSPRVMHNLGLTYEVLREERPDIIMASVSAFGGDGPHRDRIGFGPTIDAASGITYLTGYEDGGPVKPGNYFSDFFSGMHAAFSILVALRYRARTGEGQRIDLAMREVATTIVADATMDVVMNGRVPTRVGNRDPSMAPHGVYPCAGEDRWVTIAVASDEQWAQLVAITGHEEWADDDRFADAASRWTHQSELDALLAEWTVTRDRYEVMQELQAAGIAAGAVLDVKDVLNDPHVRERGVYSSVEHPELGTAPIRNLPWKLSATPVTVDRPSPTFGQHNEDVLRRFLGMTDEEIDSLIERRVLFTEPRVSE